jgi:transcriptional regulator with XRE-family HTH domain
LSQERLAYEYGLDRSAVSAIERRRNITFTSMRATLVALGVSWEDFGKAMHQKDPIPPRKPPRRRT